jgi:hypothetical protein
MISVVGCLLMVVGKTLYPSIPKNITQDDKVIFVEGCWLKVVGKNIIKNLFVCHLD